MRPVAHALEQAVRQTGRAAAAPRDLERAFLVDGNLEYLGGALHDERQLLGCVVLQAEGHAETIAQGAGEQARARRGADEREARQVEANGSRRWSLAHHDVEHEILEGRVEHLFDHAVHAVDLVDEQHVAFLEVREYRRQVARARDGRAARRFYIGMQLVCHHGRKRRLAQTRRAREQYVIGCLAPLERCLNEYRQRIFHLLLAQVIIEHLRPQAAVDGEVFLLQLGRERATVHGGIACLEHHTFQFDSRHVTPPNRGPPLRGPS